MTLRIMTASGAVIDATAATDEDLRFSARVQTSHWKEDQERGGFLALGHIFDSDPNSQFKIAVVALSGQGSPLGTWTSANNVAVPVTAADMVTIFTAMLARGAEIHARANAIKTGIATMTREQLLLFQPGW